MNSQVTPASAADAFRPVPYMGVIYVVAEAMKLGFRNGHPDWSNLGQGQPEVGPLEGAPPRIDHIDLQPGDHAYGPINGSDEMREAVAQHYNRLYRKGMKSQYTRDNVAVAAGGRLLLSRTFAAMGAVNLGYQTPDYTAYEDMLDYHRHRFTPVLVRTHESEGFKLSAERFGQIVRDQGLGAYLVSNPCNPTGVLIQGDELAAYADTARATNCLLVMDEFYSHYIYNADGSAAAGPVSAASVVEDVDRDPVFIIDGLTKNFRYPGWRVGWAVGPRDMIEGLGRAASAIDGGPPLPIQRAALQVLEPSRADQETHALRQAFAAKHQVMRSRLEKLGVRFSGDSAGTFYLWGSIAGLKAPFNDADVFFRKALEQKVMVVPGRFFDVNPGGLRTGPSPMAQMMRFSFGPSMANMCQGLDRLEAMLA